MEFYQVLRERRSIRAYQPDQIAPEILERIAEAVNLAPSACNKQPWSFRVVLNQEMRNKIGEVYTAEWLLQAPAIVVALGNRDEAWQRLEGKSIIDVDVAIAMEHLVLAAQAEGLATCWICAYDVARMNQALGILSPWEVVAISPLGKAAEEKAMPPRKTVEDIFKIIE